MGTLTIPEVKDYPAHTTAGIKAAVSMGPEFGEAIMSAHPVIAGWLRENGVQAFGPTYIKYEVINMPGTMVVENGWFVDAAIPAAVAANSGEIVVGESPAAQYVTATYTGHYDGLYNATAMLIGWAKERGIEWDAWDTPEGHAFAACYEIYHTDPGDEPDPEKWVTEIAIKVRD